MQPFGCHSNDINVIRLSIQWRGRGLPRLRLRSEKRYGQRCGRVGFVVDRGGFVASWVVTPSAVGTTAVGIADPSLQRSCWQQFSEQWSTVPVTLAAVQAASWAWAEQLSFTPHVMEATGIFPTTGALTVKRKLTQESWNGGHVVVTVGLAHISPVATSGMHW